MFLHFYAFEHLIRGSQPEFLMVRLDLRNITQERKSTFDQFQKAI